MKIKHLPRTSAIDSARELWTLLLCETELGHSTTRELVDACATQVTLAKYKSSDGKVKSQSLNTLKAACDVVVEPGGWERVDELRKTIRNIGLPSSSTHHAKKRDAIKTLEATRKRELAEQARNQKLLRERAVFIAAYSSLISIIHQSHDPDLKEKLREHEATYDIKRIKAE